MKILFVGDLNEHGNSFMRLRTLRHLGHEVYGISTVPVPRRPGIDPEPLPMRALSKFRIPWDEAHANQAVRNAARSRRYDLVWIDKGNTIRPATLRAIHVALPGTPLISVSEDDMYALHNRSWFYTRGLSLYDVVFTTKTYNVEELKLLGARRTEPFLDSFDATFCRQVELSEEDRERFGCTVGFIGTFEDARARAMIFLAENNVRVVVWGNGWETWRGKHQNLIIKNRPIYGEDYVKAINATKINLGFLRKMNRDEVTTRSVEIPACGAFMLAERTKRHQEFFTEGEEAVFFGSNDELLAHVRHYLADEPARRRIAAAGRTRCLTSGYDMATQLQSILKRSVVSSVTSLE